jgi:hypothetical protein
VKLNYTDSFSRLTTIDQLSRFMSLLAGNLDIILNGGITFADNFKGQVVECSFSAANMDSSFPHQLGRSPTGYLSLGQNAALIVYDGTNALQPQTITLRSSAIGTAQVFIF